MIFATTASLPDFPKPGKAPAGEPALVLPGHRLRPCRGADLAFLRRLYRHTRAAEMNATGWPDDVKRAFCRQQFDAQHTDYVRRFPQAEYWLILHRGDPVGRVYMDRSGPDVHLIDISLLPAHQGEGRGTAVLRALQGLAVERGCAVVLNVAHGNDRAATLYLGLGFRQVSSDAVSRRLRWEPAPAGTPEPCTNNDPPII